MTYYISNFERPKFQSNISRGEIDYFIKTNKMFTHRTSMLEVDIGHELQQIISMMITPGILRRLEGRMKTSLKSESLTFSL